LDKVELLLHVKHYESTTTTTYYGYIFSRLLLLLLIRPEQLPDNPHALPILRAAPVHARGFPDVQIAVFKPLIDALLVTRVHQFVE
jgi:hypothetical protein